MTVITPHYEVFRSLTDSLDHNHCAASRGRIPIPESLVQVGVRVEGQELRLAFAQTQATHHAGQTLETIK
ncbi:MAG TPA: hypothetical protein VG028_08510 [Terriglobia bacterium]|nr:hypothetical protein [Terriglobia bacterium]